LFQTRNPSPFARRKTQRDSSLESMAEGA
jgi:hypothetical protein